MAGGLAGLASTVVRTHHPARVGGSSHHFLVNLLDQFVSLALKPDTSNIDAQDDDGS